MIRVGYMHPFSNKGWCVTLCGLAIYIKKYLKAKKKIFLWKLKYFTMQKYNLSKKILSRKPKSLKNIITLKLMSSFNTSQNYSYKKNRPIA